MLYIIAFLLLCLVLAIPAARNTLFVVLGSAAALAVAGAILGGLGLLGYWLYSLDWSTMGSKAKVVHAPKAMPKPPLEFTLTDGILLGGVHSGVSAVYYLRPAEAPKVDDWCCRLAIQGLRYKLGQGMQQW